MKRAALYLRVSTLDQHPENQGCDLRQLAEQRGWTIVQEYTDHGFSGARARRPALDQLLADAHQNKFDIVVVWACDRLARSVRHFLEVLDQLHHLNIEFVSFRPALRYHPGLRQRVRRRRQRQTLRRRNPQRRLWHLDR